jgi:hypothetical protein
MQAENLNEIFVFEDEDNPNEVGDAHHKAG